MSILKVKLMRKDDFFKTPRLFETSPEEIASDWKMYKNSLSELKEQERERIKLKNKLTIK
jgi:hypothetical protein